MIEYVLLLAFIVIAATGVLAFNSASISGIARASNSQLSAAASTAARY